MPKVLYDLQTDMKMQIDTPEITVVKNDTNGCVLNILISTGGKALDLTDATSVTLTFKKPDNNVVVGAATVVDAAKGKVSYTLGTQESTVVGTVNCAVEVYGLSTRITTFGFYYTVVEDLDNGAGIPSTTEYTVLTTLISDTSTVKDATVQATSAANTATTSANNAATSANIAKDAAILATSDANSATSAANTAASEANTAATSANNAATSANTAKDAANTAASAANTAATSANIARDAANTAATSANIARDAANTAATSANSATVNANAATSAANTAATNATNSSNTANSLNSTIASAEASRVVAEGVRITNYNAMLSTSNMILKNPVATQTDIATTYPTPSNGWTVRAIDTGRLYRYNSSNTTWEWIDTLSISAYDALVAQITEANMSTPTDVTAVVTSLPSTVNMGEMKTIVKGRTSDTTTITTDFNNISTGGSGDALNATMKLYKGSVDPLALPTPTSNYKNELIYTPSTWAEWSKPTGVVGDSTGLEFTSDGTSYQNTSIAVNVKPSTKYGALYSVISNTISGGLGLTSGLSAFPDTTLTKNIGNNKITVVTISAISTNKLVINHSSAEPAGNKIKLKDIRVYELPVGSAIENDFNTLSADELASKYTFDSTGTTQVATLGTQITDVSKLKTQNETPLTSTNTVGRTAVYNGKTLVVQSASQPAVRDDFAGKIAGSTTVCPNKAYSAIDSTLQIPSAFYAEFSQAGGYDNVNTLNAINANRTSLVNGAIAQNLFSFDLIRIVEDKYGTIPCADQSVAGKVAWLKANGNTYKINWYGYGLCPSGNKAGLAIWNGSSWYGGSFNWVSNTSSSPTLLSSPISFNTSYLQLDGFVHILAYTDASDGVTASTIYTDYINIELQFKPVVGYDLLVDTNPRRDSGMADMVNLQKVFNPITDDYAGKVAGDNTICANVSKHNSGWFNSSLYTPSTMPTEFSTGSYGDMATLNGVSKNISTNTNLDIPQELFSFNLIRMFKDANGYDIPIDYTGVPATDLANQVQWLKDNLLNIVASAYIFGSCPAGNKAYLDAWTSNFSGTWTYKYQGLQNNVSNSASSPTLTTITTTSVTDKIDSNGMVHFLAYTDPSNGTIASTINTDYIKLDLTFKNPNNSMLMFTNASVELENLTNGKSEALLVELDLSTICTNLFGGDNAKLKSALKSIQVDAWAMGSGALNGALGYSLRVATRRFGSVDWGSGTTASNASIALYTLLETTYSADRISSSNKYYVLIYSPYASDGIIPSQVSLDYIKTTVSLTRVLSDGAYKVRSVGKNLFDKNSNNIIKGKYLSNNGVEGVLAGFNISPFIKVKNNTNYAGFVSAQRVCYYDINKNFVSTNDAPTTVKTSPANTYYVRCTLPDANLDTFQLELGSVATAYEPYKETVAYTPPIELRSVGSVADTFDANSGLLTKRVEQKVLQASDVVSIVIGANIDYVLINKPADYTGYGQTADGKPDSITLENYTQGQFYLATVDDIANINKFSIRCDTTKIAIVVTKGTYANLAQAQSALTGKKLTYVLTTPITTQYDAQIIDVQPSGTVYCEPIIRDTFKYTTKVDIANSLYPIKALTKVYKVISNAGEEVVMTPIDLSTCTVAGDGLSFTSTALTVNDYVEYEYEFEAWRTLIPTLNISYPNNLRGVVDGNVVQIARLDGKLENLEHFTVAMLLNHEMRLVAHSI